MAFCKNCGAELEENVKFCTNCGAKVEAPAEAPKTENASNGEPTKSQPAAEKSGWDKFTDTPGITNEIDPEDAKNNMAMGILAYLFWLCLIPKFARKESKFCQYHATQGMFLAVIESALIVLGIIIGFIPIINILLGLVIYVAEVACTFFAVVGIINVVKGEARELPIIGKYNFFNKK